MNEHAIAIKKTEVVPTEKQDINNDIVMMAMQKEYSPEYIEKMMDLQDRHNRNEAKKAYTVAMSEFKKNPPVVTKDKDNRQYNSKYTTLGNLVNSALPVMSKCGLSHSWSIDQSQAIAVTCTVTHVGGHSESITMSAPPDKSGSKNPIQEIKSTITYLKSATFESIMGLASTDANIDDDGNGSGGFITDSQKKEINKLIKQKVTDINKFLEFANAETTDTILKSEYNRVIKGLKSKPDKGEK